jgi:hypothetical protein
MHLTTWPVLLPIEVQGVKRLYIMAYELQVNVF